MNFLKKEHQENICQYDKAYQGQIGVQKNEFKLVLETKLSNDVRNIERLRKAKGKRTNECKQNRKNEFRHN